MDLEALDTIEARAEAATPGPWRVEDHEYNQGGVYYSVPTSVAVGGPTDDPRDWREIAAVDRYAYDSVPPPDGFDQALYEQMQPARDLQFIAHAREDVPALLAEVKRLMADLAHARAWSDYHFSNSESSGTARYATDGWDGEPI